MSSMVHTRRTETPLVFMHTALLRYNIHVQCQFRMTNSKFYFCSFFFFSNVLLVFFFRMEPLITFQVQNRRSCNCVTVPVNIHLSPLQQTLLINITCQIVKMYFYAFCVTFFCLATFEIRNQGVIWTARHRKFKANLSQHVRFER